VVQRVPDDTPYPIQLKEHGVDFLLDHRHLWIRTPRQAAILRIRAEAVRAAHEYMDSQGYILTEAPIFTPAACEGTTTLFEVQYIDDEKAYLTQSGQLYVEATAMALGKVYTFGPTFRAEKSKTRRHLTEFWMLEPEAAYAHLEDMMALGEGLVSHVVQSVLKNRARELETLGRDVPSLRTSSRPFPRITYDEAVEILQQRGNPAKWGDDFGGDEETILSSTYDRPVMVHRYPGGHQGVLHAAGPGAARAGAGIRHARARRLRRNHRRRRARRRLRFAPEAAARTQSAGRGVRWYLDLRRYGSVPHAGFGLGLERTVAWICGTEHIREVIPFPRMIYRVYP
jgi:asparaginyl-tRNA synthetase